MKETRMPPAQSANLAANSDNTIYGVGVIRPIGTMQWNFNLNSSIFIKKMHLKMLLRNGSHFVQGEMS